MIILRNWFTIPLHNNCLHVNSWIITSILIIERSMKPKIHPPLLKIIILLFNLKRKLQIVGSLVLDLKNNTSTILATTSAIPPIAGPSQFVDDNNSLNESQTGPTQNPPTDLLLSNNENIGIDIYSPMHIQDASNVVATP